MFNKEKLKALGQQVLVVLVAAILVLLALKFLFSTKYFPPNSYDKAAEKQLQILKRSQDSLSNLLIEVRKDQQNLLKKEEENNRLIENNNRDLQIIKNKYNEKVNSINGYTPTQLDSFFTDRYGKYN